MVRENWEELGTNQQKGDNNRKKKPSKELLTPKMGNLAFFKFLWQESKKLVQSNSILAFFLIAYQFKRSYIAENC